MPFVVTKSGTGDLTYSQTRRASLRTPTRGVRTAAHATSWRDEVLAVALTLPPAAAFSHTTAAQILGLPTPPGERTIHVTVPKDVNRGSRKAVTWHQRDVADSVQLVGGLRVTDALRTWRDLGTCLAVPELVAITDVALRRGLLRVTDLVVPRGMRGGARTSPSRRAGRCTQ